MSAKQDTNETVKPAVYRPTFSPPSDLFREQQFADCKPREYILTTFSSNYSILIKSPVESGERPTK
jgi:hypothetical protein